MYFISSRLRTGFLEMFTATIQGQLDIEILLPKRNGFDRVQHSTRSHCILVQVVRIESAGTLCLKLGRCTLIGGLYDFGYLSTGKFRERRYAEVSGNGLV